MLCYQDRTFCKSSNCALRHNCPKWWSDEMKAKHLAYCRMHNFAMPVSFHSLPNHMDCFKKEGGVKK